MVLVDYQSLFKWFLRRGGWFDCLPQWFFIGLLDVVVAFVYLHNNEFSELLNLFLRYY